MSAQEMSFRGVRVPRPSAGTTVTVASGSEPANSAAALLTVIVMVVAGTSPLALMDAGVNRPMPENCRLAVGVVPTVPAASR